MKAALAVVTVLPAALFAVLTPVAPPAVAAEGPRPNILIVNTDDQRFDTMQYLPKTLQWMSGGKNYPNFQVAIPSCCPSRSDMFTGRYPHNNGVRLQSQAANLDMTTTWQYYLKQGGYSTAMAGKFLVSWPAKSAPPYFDRYSMIQGAYNDYYAYVNGQTKHLVRTDAAPRNYSTIWLGDQLRGYLHGFEANDTKPWLAYYTPQAPHFVNPGGLAKPEPKYANAPVGACLQPNEADRSDKPAYVRWRTYDAAQYTQVCQAQIRTLFTVDDTMDEIFTQLQADGELSNTLVIFMSDNGYLWGEHGYDAKFVPYLPSVKVPLRIRWDGHVTAGTDNRLAVNVDVLPTVLQAAGVTIPAGKPAIDGESLLTPSHRTVIYTEYFRDLDNAKIWTWASLYDRHVHYIEYTKPDNTKVREYYNTDSDPVENLNLLGDASSANNPPASELNALAARLATLRTAAGPPMVQ